ncbi:glycosyltransferase family 4 protein [Levilactobacillus brevis]|uniref:Glycosyltransferase family 4 protein n=1 Tax=Levilactobacillus brevis TaxID=1580 RepID=A0AA41ENZ2_LEVBR|nr:glycosyltransferase family 4 protein [Levilactobacillus brevis]MBS0947103.1 glycosyltransferase family 4 protein [Levilactobacillus brevis]MBS1010247.1 glycosyltransferase family 4 protein [Levilactobacillus brevis]MCU0200212.1 glycosyltransferase family 4 protein [Levilactobacillus brevis]ODP93424.1 hypothetical protein BGC39_03085 [Levilactobacillus brevis]ORJ55057.1 hypothetical protein LBR_04110 [Levilactobacillus brevis]
MKLNEQNVLLFSRTMGQGGAEKVVLQICEILLPHVNKVVVCSSGGVNVKKLNEMSVKHYVIPDIGKKSVKKGVETLHILSEIIKKEKITVIHSHHRMAAFYSKVLREKYNVVLINTVHNVFFNKRKLTYWGYKNTNLIACGEHVKDNLIDYFCMPPEQVSTIHNAVDTKLVPFGDNKRLKELHNQGFFLVGNIGRLTRQKGMSFFIKSMINIRKENLKIKYIIIGDGKDRDELLKLTDELELKDDIIFLGYVSNISNILNQLDLVVLSSLWEGLPLTPIEAFSMGRTVIGTDVGGTSEIISDARNGYLISPRSSDAISDKVIYLFNNSIKRKILERNAHKTYLSKFRLSIFEKKTLDYYESI